MANEFRPALKKSMRFCVIYIGLISLFASGCGPSLAPNAANLCAAVREADATQVKYLLKRGADPNGADSDGLAPLEIAAMNGNIEIMEILVQAGAKINDSLNDITPLLLAIQSGKFEAVRWLVSKDANINARTSKGVTPLLFAILNNQPDICVFLIDNGADVEAKNSAGTNGLILAITAGLEGVSRKLVEKSTEINVQTKGNKTTALMMASHRDLREIASLLLDKGADPDLRDSFGKSALDYARSQAMKELLANGQPNSTVECHD